ncbi:MAG: hypothetical protein HQL20_11050 [Candidatus Omnitrophica bacterium]|nr:hypothetical protein [Candidatus Omnitrophota bacterium]
MSGFKKSFLYRVLSEWVMICFLFSGVLPSGAYAQALTLPVPGVMVSTSPAFVPVIMKGVQVHPDNPFLFDFIVDTGDTGLKAGPDDAPIRLESRKLIKYFLASLSLPEEDQWVNLSPYEHDRMMPAELEKTELGRDMLAQDYILKQVTASLIYPEKTLGKQFWSKVYSKVQERFNNVEMPIDTFNKVWIVADKADVYVNNNTALVVGSHLKVMLESDYVALSRQNDLIGSQASSRDLATQEATTTSTDSQEYTRQIVREIVLPALEDEVNTGKNFANLRQIFHAMILATWYKKNLREALLNQVYSNTAKTNGVNLGATDLDPQAIYNKYVTAYTKGAFNLIKEDVLNNGETIPRKYFSGGIPNLGAATRVVGKAANGTSTFKQAINVQTRVEAASHATKFPLDNQNILSHDLWTIGRGQVSTNGPIEYNGYSQIKFLGDNQEQESLRMDIGRDLTLNNGFISLRRTIGASHIEGHPDTLVVQRMAIGNNVTILNSGEVVNVTRIGNHVLINGGALIEIDGKGIGSRSKITGMSDIRMSAIGEDVIVDGQSKIFKARILNGAKVTNSSVIGGHDELSPQWRQEDEGGKGRGIIIREGAEVTDCLLHHMGAEKNDKINPIIITSGVKIKGVFLVSSRNTGLVIEASLAVPDGKRVYIEDGVKFDESIKALVLNALNSTDTVRVQNEEGRILIKAEPKVLAAKPQDIDSLKNRLRAEWIIQIPLMFAVDTQEKAEKLNSLLQQADVYIDKNGEIHTDIQFQNESVVSIGKGGFVYPGLFVFARAGRKVSLNLLEIGSRGGCYVFADRSDVHLGPIQGKAAGRTAGAALIRDVYVDGEFNNFGGYADTISGTAKVTLRNQAILRNATVKSPVGNKGEIIVGWYQADWINIEIEGNHNIGLTHGGVISGEEGQPYEIKGAFVGGYRESIGSSDQAMNKPGGIELNARKMQMNEKGQKINMTFDAAMAEQFKRGDFTGLRPVIYRITPIANPALLLE